jgi:hypothetical protein
MENRSRIHPFRWREQVPFAERFIELLAKEGVPHPSLFTVKDLTNTALDHYYAVIESLPREKHPRLKNTGAQAAGLGVAAANFFLSGQNAFLVTPELGEQLSGQSLAEFRMADLRYPYRFFWLSLESMGFDMGFPGEPNVIDGAYIDSTINDVVLITFTSRRTQCSEFTWPLNAEPSLELFLFSDGSPNQTLRDCFHYTVENNHLKVDRRKISNQKFDVDLPRLASDPSEVRERAELTLGSDGPYVKVATSKARQIEEIRWNNAALPVVEKALAYVGSFLSFMALKPEMRREERISPTDVISSSNLSEAPSGRGPSVALTTQSATGRDGFRPVHVIGRVETADDDGQKLMRGELEWGHTRRGHNRLQAYGPKMSLRKEVWVEESVVRPDLPLRPKHGHGYIVHENESVSPPGPSSSR